MKFSDFPLNSQLLQGINEAGYIECTPVQEQTLKSVLHDHRDVYAQSQTGTGKTAAFLIPTFDHLLKQENEDSFALIIVPTRELAAQVEKEASLLGKHLNMRMVAIYGGVGYDQQMKALKASPRIIVGTPGRLIDYCKQDIIDLKKASVLAIDEADRLFDMGFVKDIKFILGKMRPAKERLNMLYSATLNAKVGNLAWEYMNNPADIVIEPEQVTVDAIDQGVFHVARNEKMNLLLGILHHERPFNAVIFSNTKAGAGQIAERLTKSGYRCALLEGNVPQRKRIRIVNDLKAGKLQFLAATDVAARGLHVPDLNLVVNYDLPDDHENYVHRIGRTARAGKTGKAYSFACDRYVYNLDDIQKYIGKKIPVKTIDAGLEEAINEVKEQQKALKVKEIERRKDRLHHEGDSLESDRLESEGGSIHHKKPRAKPHDRPAPRNHSHGNRRNSESPRSNDDNPRRFDRKDGEQSKGRFERKDGEQPRGRFDRKDGEQPRGRFDRKDGEQPKGRFDRKDGDQPRGRFERKDGDQSKGRYERKDGDQPRGRFERKDGDQSKGRYERKDGDQPRGRFDRKDGDQPKGRYERKDGDQPKGRYERKDGDQSKGRYERKDGDQPRGRRPSDSRQPAKGSKRPDRSADNKFDRKKKKNHSFVDRLKNIFNPK